MHQTAQPQNIPLSGLDFGPKKRTQGFHTPTLGLSTRPQNIALTKITPLSLPISPQLKSHFSSPNGGVPNPPGKALIILLHLLLKEMHIHNRCIRYQSFISFQQQSNPQRSQGQKCPMGIPGLPRRRQRHLRQPPL